MWTEAKIKRLLATSQKAIYRALVRLDVETPNPLPPEGRLMAKWVREWNATPEDRRRFSYPLGLNKLAEARQITMALAWKLAEIANENEQYEAEARAEREAAERYYEDDFDDSYSRDDLMYSREYHEHYHD